MRSEREKEREGERERERKRDVENRHLKKNTSIPSSLHHVSVTKVLSLPPTPTSLSFPLFSPSLFPSLSLPTSLSLSLAFYPLPLSLSLSFYPLPLCPPPSPLSLFPALSLLCS